MTALVNEVVNDQGVRITVTEADVGVTGARIGSRAEVNMASGGAPAGPCVRPPHATEVLVVMSPREVPTDVGARFVAVLVDGGACCLLVRVGETGLGMVGGPVVVATYARPCIVRLLGTR